MGGSISLASSYGAEADRVLCQMDFWSPTQALVTLTSSAGNKSLPSVVVAGLPTGATISRAIAMFKADKIEDDSASDNDLDGATVAATSQVFQVKENAAGSYIDAIDLVDTQFLCTASTKEGGPVVIGDNDVKAQVDGNDTYAFQWLQAKSTGDSLYFRDVQMGIRIWYSI